MTDVLDSVSAAPTAGAGEGAVGHAIAIFASRETSEVLGQTIAAASIAAEQAVDATSPRRPIIDVLVNGNAALADAAARHARTTEGGAGSALRLRVWHLALADKAHAWNQYVETIWPASELAFFVDGYVRLWPNTVTQLSRRLRAAPDAVAATGVPTAGRSASAERRAMLADGGIQGNCFCIAGATLQRMKQIGFRLPLGLYRGDALIGAALAFRLDPARHAWNLKSAVLVEPEAGWDVEGRRLWRLADWRALAKRRGRQAQGELENRAVRDHLSVRRQPPQALPRTIAELVLDWAERCPDDLAHALRHNRRAAQALDAFSAPRDWRAAGIAPTLVIDTAASN